MSHYSIGLGIYDITGPAAEVGMMGYSMVGQRTSGIHTRLRSRAFIVESENKRIVYVTADLGMIFQGVSLAVLKKLKESFGQLYNDGNVILTATHTHSGPGGYSHYTLYNLSILGFNKQNFDVIVDGIFTSIVKAHNNLRPGKIKIIEQDIPKPEPYDMKKDYGFNRSLGAYELNPEAKKKTDTDNINRAMTLLRFEDEHGMEMGILNWLALHPTNIGNKNTLISSDNKGYAAYRFEEKMGADYLEDNIFVAGFGQSEAGDISPNVFGYPDGVMDYARMTIIGNKLFEFALDLYSRANEELDGEIDYRHRYIDMSNIQIDLDWISEEDKKHGNVFKTCNAAIGISKIAGSTEDGKGIELIKEGMVFDGVKWPKITLVPEDQKCHREKVILLVTGKMKPHPWTPNILPIQLAKIGQLGLIAVPFECTTMAGRRLKNTVKNHLPEIKYLVIAGYANAYAGYTTTREEYSAQQYEGASTHFGPFTLNAYQQEFDKLALAMKNGNPVTSKVHPVDLSDEQFTLESGVLFDDKPWNKKWGAVEIQPQEFYYRGQTVSVCLWGAHPKNNLKIQDTYLKVERFVEGEWKVVARDWDPDTIFRWERHGIAGSNIWIEWTTPEEVEKGIYRISHYGSWKSGRFWKFGKIRDYSSVTREFEVK